MQAKNTWQQGSRLSKSHGVGFLFSSRMNTLQGISHATEIGFWGKCHHLVDNSWLSELNKVKPGLFIYLPWNTEGLGSFIFLLCELVNGFGLCFRFLVLIWGEILLCSPNRVNINLDCKGAAHLSIKLIFSNNCHLTKYLPGNLLLLFFNSFHTVINTALLYLVCD